jgi:hypothetical protein
LILLRFIYRYIKYFGLRTGTLIAREVINSHSEKVRSKMSSDNDNSSHLGRKHLKRKAQFQERYTNESSGGGWSRNNSEFTDPVNSFTEVLQGHLQGLGGVHADLDKARRAFSRKGMGDKVTKGMKKRDKKLKRKQRTPEAQRMQDHPDSGMQPLGVERDHINANSQVATQITAFGSAFVGANSKKREEVTEAYQSFAEAHELPKSDSRKLAKELQDTMTKLEKETLPLNRQRKMTAMLNSHTATIADQPGNLRFGRSQHTPDLSLNLTLLDDPTVRSNQDVGSFWDGNRQPDGSESPRTAAIKANLFATEAQGIFPTGLAKAATKRPVVTATGDPFGSTKQQGDK